MSISKEIISIIEVLCQKLGIVVDWTSETILPQIQNVLEHFIQYEIFSSWFWIWFALSFVVISGIILTIACVKFGVGDFSIGMIVVTVIVVIAFFVVAGIQGHDIVTAIYFPEKAIYDYVSALMKGVS